MNAINQTYAEATEEEPFESGISDASKLRERGNAALGEARILARYGGRDEELTKPSVMLLDWSEDEVTVRWDSVRHQSLLEASAPDDDDELYAPTRFRGIGPRAGSILLGLVLGVSVTIGILAIFAPRTTPDESALGSDNAFQAAADPTARGPLAP